MLAGVFLSCLAAIPPVVPPAEAQCFPVFRMTDEMDFAGCLQDTSDVATESQPTDAGEGGSPAVQPLQPAKRNGPQPERTGVDWRKLGRDSMLFLTIMHAFRWGTEAGTRAGGIGLGTSYVRSVGNLHGWNDGDPFYVNYVGHPMQGAVSGRLYLVNYPRFNRTEFGKSPEYWKGKLRAAAFAFAISEEFEIGPWSEASIGHIQAEYPQQGFVDHVITPTVGLGWMVAEDAVDRYVIRPLEGRTTNKYERLVLRSGLNPARSFANVLAGRVPWDRGSRPGILEYKGEPADLRAALVADPFVLPPAPKIAPFEFNVSPSGRQFSSGPCVGGGAEAAYRVMPQLQLALTVDGCKLLGLPTNVTGDALIYQVGPQWTPVPTGKWSPYAHVFVGGMKITHEELYPDKKAELLKANKDPALANALHDEYTSHQEASGAAISIGTGIDYKLNATLAFRLASVEYLRSTVGMVGGRAYSSGLQVTTGMTLRLGTW